jgi:hypothetical protein
MSVTDTAIQPASARSFWLGFAAYVLPSFPIAYVWHLVLFAPMYHDLAIYRADVIIPLGLLSMLIQGVVFSWLYPRMFVDRSAVLGNGLRYGLGMALLSWSFTTLAVAAKHVMTSVPTYLALETAFTLVQFAIAGPLIALAYKRG